MKENWKRNSFITLCDSGQLKASPYLGNAASIDTSVVCEEENELLHWILFIMLWYVELPLLLLGSFDDYRCMFSWMVSWPKGDSRFCSLNCYWFFDLRLLLWLGFCWLARSLSLLSCCIPAVIWKRLGCFASWTMKGSRSSLPHILLSQYKTQLNKTYYPSGLEISVALKITY